jgi:hypothetical protein
MPEPRNGEGDAQSRQPLAQLLQGQIHFRRNPSLYHLFQRGNTGNPIPPLPQTLPTPFPLKPPAYLIDPHSADLESSGNFRRPLPTLQRTQYSVPQIL